VSPITPGNFEIILRFPVFFKHAAIQEAGGGYFSIRFAQAAGRNGEVYSVDTNEEYQKFAAGEAAKSGLSNIKFVLATENNTNLPDNCFDLIFFRNVLHHIENRVEYFKSLKTKLKAGGRIAAIEYKPGGSIFSFKRFFGHNIPSQKITEEFTKAGFKKAEELDFLPEQSFAIFKY